MTVYILYKKSGIPNLTSSSLHRCLQRHGISRLPKKEGDKTAKVQEIPIGYFHIDSAAVATEEGKLQLLVVIDRSYRVSYIEEYEKKLGGLLPGSCVA